MEVANFHESVMAVVICPLSVTEGWALEMARFAPHLRVLRYVGNKEEREELRQKICEHVNEQQARVGPTLFLNKYMNLCISYMLRSGNSLWNDTIFEKRGSDALLFNCLGLLQLPSVFRTSVFTHKDALLLEALQANPELSFDVLLTTYELALADVKFLSRIRWCYAIVDEAQRLKNANSV